MLIVAANPSHDGAIAAIEDDKLLFSLESEKDSFRRHHRLTPMTALSLLEHLGAVPDVIALGGWTKPVPGKLRQYGNWSRLCRRDETSSSGARSCSGER